MQRARSSRWVVSVWAPKNSTRPRIIPESPTTLPLLSRRQRFTFRVGSANGKRSRLLRLLSQIAIVDIADRDRAPRERAAKTIGEFQRQAGVERTVDRLQISGAGVGGDAGGGIGQARPADHVAGFLEAEPHRHLHARARALGCWRRPAGAQGGEQIADGVEVVVGPDIFRRILLGGDSLDRELQVLAVGIEDFRDTGTLVEDAAEGRGTGPVVEHAAGGMRERRGVDLPPSGIGRSGGHQSRDSDAETENDASAHATALRIDNPGRTHDQRKRRHQAGTLSNLRANRGFAQVSAHLVSGFCGTIAIGAAVIARLDRAIQYSAASAMKAKEPGV